MAPGEQQPEADHEMQSSQSGSGSNQDQFYREAFNGGYFSYNLSTDKKSDLSLIVRYWGAEWGNRKFEIYIDGQLLIAEDNTGRWNHSKFFDVSYAIPDSMIEGKDHVRVKFQSVKDNTAGGIYSVRLVE